MAGGAAAVANHGLDNAKPNTRAFAAIAMAMLGAAMFGADQINWGTVPALESFKEHWCSVIGLDNLAECSDDNSHFHTIFTTWGCQSLVLGMFVGAVLPGPLMAKHLGRRLTVSVGTMTCFIGCLLASFLCGTSLLVFFIGRVITGLGCGMTCFVLPMYNAEISTASVRGATGNFFQFMCQVGVFLAPVILSPQVGLQDWKVGMMLPGFLGVIVSIFVWFCPESPAWTLKKYGAERARHVLETCRQGDVSEELAMMEKVLQDERDAGEVPYIELFTNKGLKKRFFVACWFQVAQQLTGINGINSNTSILFAASGYSGDPTELPFGPTNIYSAVCVISCVIGISIVEKVGRKPMVLWSSMIMGPLLLLMAASLFLNKFTVIVEVGIWIFGFCYSGCWGAIPWLYPSEIFNQRERERALSLSTAVNFFVNFWGLYIFNFVNKFDTYIVFCVFGVFNVANILFVATMVKETKGVPLEDIIYVFDGHSANSEKHAPLV